MLAGKKPTPACLKRKAAKGDTNLNYVMILGIVDITIDKETNCKFFVLLIIKADENR